MVVATERTEHLDDVAGTSPYDEEFLRGDEGDRTLDLRLAKPALYQLSYVPGDPSLQEGGYSGWCRRRARSRWRSMRSS